MQVRFHPSLPEHARRLMDTLGVEIVWDESAPREPPATFTQLDEREAAVRAARQRARRQARQLELSRLAAERRVPR